jgi:hypothetical protein
MGMDEGDKEGSVVGGRMGEFEGKLKGIVGLLVAKIGTVGA